MTIKFKVYKTEYVEYYTRANVHKDTAYSRKVTDWRIVCSDEKIGVMSGYDTMKSAKKAGLKRGWIFEGKIKL